MLAIEAPEMLSGEDEYASLFLNFIVLCFCNSLANYWYLEISLVPLWVKVYLVFCRKNYRLLM